MHFLFTGIVSTFVGHPMDTIKVVQQVTNTSVLKATRNIYNKDKASDRIIQSTKKPKLKLFIYLFS